MAKSYSLVFIVLFLLTLGSCQSLEQIPIDYLQPADLSFPPQLRKVAIVNNTSDAPDNKLITETEKIKEGTPLISRATSVNDKSQPNIPNKNTCFIAIFIVYYKNESESRNTQLYSKIIFQRNE